MSYDASQRTIGELLLDFAAIMRELRTRGITRTNNSPTGDIAEAIVAAHYGGKLAVSGTKGWDVQTPDGERIQVKSVRNTPTTSRKNLSPIRDQNYDSVVVVVFDEDYTVTDGLKLSREVAEDLAKWVPHINGHVLYMTGPLLNDPRVEHVDLTDAYARLSA